MTAQEWHVSPRRQCLYASFTLKSEKNTLDVVQKRIDNSSVTDHHHDATERLLN